MNNISASVPKLALVVVWLATVLGAQAASPNAQQTILGLSANAALDQSQASNTAHTNVARISPNKMGRACE